MQTKDYNEIYNEYSPKIRRYLKTTFNSEDAEDLLQEIFIKVYKSLPTFRNESGLNTWIYRIATNAIIDKLKSKNYKLSKVQGSITAIEVHNKMNQLTTSFDNQIEKEEMYSCVKNFIGTLTEKNRTVFVLSQYELLSNAEISEILQISIDSVKIRLHRAKEALNTLLKKNCNIYFDDNGEISCEPK